MENKSYVIVEGSNRSFIRQVTEILAKDLTQAKQIASRQQFFENTTLRVETLTGQVLSVKERGKWQDAV